VSTGTAALRAIRAWSAGAWSVPVICAAAALALGGGAAAAAADGQGVTVLVHLSSEDSIGRLVPPSFVRVQPGAHYDGVYFYAVARDPLGQGVAHGLIDRTSYRYGHPGYGWLAWIASGGGRPGAVPYALLAVSLLAFGVGGFAASVLARELGLSAWWGLSAALNPGLLLAVTLDTAETVSLAVVLLAVLAWLRGRWAPAAAAIAAACFTKEPLLLVPAGIFVWEAVRFLRGRHPARLLPQLGALVLGPALYAGWLLYCRLTFGSLPLTGTDELAAPFSGWASTLHRAASKTMSEDPQIGMLAPAVVVALGGLFVIGSVRALRLQSPLDAIFVAFAVLAFCTDWFVLLYPKDMLRVFVVPLGLAPFVFARVRVPDDRAPG
jgi:hypothetical protein